MHGIGRRARNRLRLACFRLGRCTGRLSRLSLRRMLPDVVLQKLEGLPVQSGVYLFRDKKGVVVYVGKAKSLRSRVRSYFQDASGDNRLFIPILQRTIGDLDTIITANEKEATILENNLIKEHQPRYNVKLRDDKDFITLRLGALRRAEASTQVVGSGSRPRTSRGGGLGDMDGEGRGSAEVVGSGARGRTSRGGGDSGVDGEEGQDPPAVPGVPESADSGERSAALWSRLEVVRRPTPDGARYFGPYHSATAARRTLHLVNKHFQLRTCRDAEFVRRKRPCLQHQIKRCPAPCVLPVDRPWYAEQVDAVAKFLEGRHDELSRELLAKMKSAALETRFELAGIYRDQLRAVEKVRQEQRVVTIDDINRDVVGFYREGELVEIALLLVRAGKLADVVTYSIKQTEIPDEEIVAAFLAQHYGPSLVPMAAEADGEGLPPDAPAPIAPFAALVPDEVILPREPEGVLGIAEWLTERAGHKVVLLTPKRGHRVDLLTMANDNAQHAFFEKQRQADDVQERLRDLQQRLRLPMLPRRIECCDISHLGGRDTVGAIVAMTDGVLDKKRYRTFNVRGAVRPEEAQGLNDDYGSMYEVLARRFRRALIAKAAPEGTAGSDGTVAGAGSADPPRSAAPDEATIEPRDPENRESGDADWDAPDLFVVDGGRGQLGVAQAAASDLGLHDLSIVALAKERENLAGETLVDRIYLPGQKNPIALKSSTTSLFLLARLRDEAHRFSNRARMRIGKKRRFHSPLDDVKGLGPKAKKALLSHVGNVAAIRIADDATLLAVPGVRGRHVKALRAAHPKDPGSDVPAAASDPATRPISVCNGANGSEPLPRSTLPAEPIMPTPNVGRQPR
jgi:excinuclease ABC subunit C